MRVAKTLALLVFVVLFVPSWAAAQTATTGTVVGTVTDPQAAAVVGAKVELRNMGTNEARGQATGGAGQYSFPSLAPGLYKISVTMQGFRTATISDFKVDVAKSYVVDFKLELGQLSEVVQVEATARVELQTTDASVGNALSSEGLLRLGSLTRNAVEFLTLQPLTTPNTSANTGGTVAGARSDQNTYTLDGIDITDNSIAGGDTLRTILPLSVDTVEEFRLGTTNPNATFGRSAGGQVALIGRRGTNSFHGTGFWYHQNDELNANSWTNNRLGIKKAEQKDNRFGGRVGGPIWKDKTFFFGSYEGRRFPQSFDILRFVPSADMRSGILHFRDAAGNNVAYNLATSMLCGPTNSSRCDPRGVGISPTISALMALYPTGNDPAASAGNQSADGLNIIGFRSTAGAPLKDDYVVFRLDHNFSSKWRFNGSYNYFRRLQTLGVGNQELDIRGGSARFVGIGPTRGDGVTAGLVTQITPSLLNTFKFGWIRDRNATQRISPSASATSLALSGTNTSAGFVALDPTRGLLDAPIDVGTQRARTQGNKNRNFQFIEDMSFTRGTHVFQWGGNIRYLPTLHVRDDKVVGSLASLVASLNAGASAAFTTIPATNRPPTCPQGSTTATNCLAQGDVSRWDRLYTASLGLIDNVSILMTRDGSLKPQPLGTSLIADTTLKAFDFYFQDTWRISPSFTLTYGLAYQWQTPPTEKDGKQTFIIDNLTGQILTGSGYIEAKHGAALRGQVFNPQLAYVPINSADRSRIYDIDWTNVAPRVSAAWSPPYDSGWLGKLFGARKSVVRGGFGIVYDRLNTVQSVIIPTLGVGFAQTISVNAPACNASGAGGANCSPASGPTDPANSRFRVGVDGTIPLPMVPAAAIPIVPSRPFGEVLSFQVDPDFKVGRSYSIDFTIQRELPWSLLLEVGYAGRLGRNLPQSINFNSAPFFHKDTASGQTFAQAFDVIATALRAGQLPSAIAQQPWFENQLPGAGNAAVRCSAATFPSSTASFASRLGTTFTDGQLFNLFSAIDGCRTTLGLSTFGNQQVLELFMRTDGGRSNYHAFIATLRKRTSHGLLFDLNYTLSKSLDQVGAVQNSASYYSSSFFPDIEYGPSFFDRRHVLNAAVLYDLPFGRGRKFGLSSSAFDKFIGGWYVSSIFRANSGLPVTVTESDQVFGGGLNFNFDTGAIPTTDPLSFGNGVNRGVRGSGGIGTAGDPAGCSAAGICGSGLNLFSDPAAAFNNYRKILLGSDGRSGRANPLRGLRNWNLDMSFGKKTSVTEQVQIVFSFDFFNIFNHPVFNTPALSLASRASFGVITSQFVPPNRNAGSRWIQFGFRVEF